MITLLEEDSLEFPPLEKALKSPNGLLAVGGDLKPARLMSAYQKGIFPWYNPSEPILWWSPDPRAVLFLDELRISRSLAKVLRNKSFTVSFNQDFEAVINACAQPRTKQPETWLSQAMIDAYCVLHKQGFAQSVEVWRDHQLIGGLYGVDCGGVFTGESMFSFESNASKIALVHLVEHLKNRNYKLIDCQILNPFLEKMGAREIPRKQFIEFIS